jgi:curved DNA-binding protein CbpA
MTTTYWTALNIKRGATAAEIKAAYRSIAAEMHPDHGGDAKKLALVSMAYDVLKREPNRAWGHRSDLMWARDYEAAFDIKPDATANERSAAEDLAEKLRRQTAKVERMRREAAEWMRQDAEERNERDRAERAGKARREADAKQHAKADRCGHGTKSGPCVRPFGHAHGHMSQAVLDVKTANAKAKRQAQKGA